MSDHARENCTNCLDLQLKLTAAEQEQEKLRARIKAYEDVAPEGADRRECADCNALFVCETWSALTRCTACHFMQLKIEAEQRADRAEAALTLATEAQEKAKLEHQETRGAVAAWKQLFNQLADATAPYRHTPEDRHLWERDNGTPDIDALVREARENRALAIQATEDQAQGQQEKEQ